MLRFGRFDVTLDDIDQLLLVALQDDARSSYRDLGEQVGLSPPAVAARMRRLEAAGVIAGYSVEVDPAALGHPMLAIIRLKSPGGQRDVDALARQMPEVVECHRVTGGESHVIRAWARDPAHLEQLLDQFWQFGETTTNIVTSSPVPPRPVDVRRLAQVETG